MPNDTDTPIRVLLVDDHVVMRTGLRLVIESQPGMVVAGEASHGAEALELAAREPVDVILLDLDLGEERGVDLLPSLLAAAAGARVIVLTGVRDADEFRRAVRLGALGLVLKEQATGVLAQAIRHVHSGEAWLDPALVASVLAGAAREQGQGHTAAQIASLSERERAVIELICQGLRNKQVAERLCVSQTTVVHHLTSIFNKLGLANRLELVAFGYSHGLAQQPHDPPLR